MFALSIFLGLASILWCLTAPLSLPLRAYFAAQLLQGIVGVLAYLRWGNMDSRYLVTYEVVTVPILLSCLWIAWESLSGTDYWHPRPAKHRLLLCAIPAILALTLCRESYPVESPANAFAWANVGQAFVLALAGMVAGGNAPYVEEKWSTGILGTLWIVQAVASLGYALHLKEWEKLIAWLPALLCFVAFFLVGIIHRLDSRK